MAEKVQRCAVYTRKSTEDGLEQEFNSLHAQYDACSAYALSQKHEGWLLLQDRYDDGGFSGGNMQRPGLQRLLADVAAGKVDIILVYKIDRLTRSLADFAKIVEVLDKAGASFVSITQAFNTTTSMGRLTLNMMLSFAQFEREVTGERIRDKIAASKRKGLWMGGPVPLGYDVENRKLVVNDKEAALVRLIFQRYLEASSVAELVNDLNAQGHKTKIQRRTSGPHRGGCEFRRGTLYHLLANRIYLGELTHKGEAFPAEHEAIITAELFGAVEGKLKTSASGTARRIKAKEPSLFIGLMFDGEGRAMSPSHAAKPGKRYRYYVTRPDLIAGSPAWRVPADDLEQLVCTRMSQFLSDQHSLLGLAGDLPADEVKRLLASAHTAVATIRSGSLQDKSELLMRLIERIALRHDGIDLSIDQGKLGELLGFVPQTGKLHEDLVLSLPATRVRRGRQIRLVVPGPEPAGKAIPRRDEKLVSLLAEAHEAQQLVLAEPSSSLASLAKNRKRCRKRLAKLVELSCLAPDVVSAVLQGQQPRTLSAKLLLDRTLPMRWSEQRVMLGFA